MGNCSIFPRRKLNTDRLAMRQASIQQAFLNAPSLFRLQSRKLGVPRRRLAMVRSEQDEQTHPSREVVLCEN